MALDTSDYTIIGQSNINPRTVNDFSVNLLILICNTNFIFLTMMNLPQNHVMCKNGVVENRLGRLFQKFYSIYLGPLCKMGLYIFSINIVLITMCNMSMINPGPKTIRKPLKVFYNNVHGLVNTRDLASDHPPLNMTKIHELHGFLFSNKPDIVILSETWLKKSIKDHEVLLGSYDVFRLDRTLDTHPWDPNNH